jgi:hypothetical protein
MELSERKHLIHNHLIRTREELLDVIGQMDTADWERPVQAGGGGWTVKQVLLHVATSESGQLAAGKAIAAGQPTVPDDFDLNRYNRRQIEKNQVRQPPEILYGMAESRQKVLAFLDDASAEDLDKRGKHGRGDVISLEQLFYRIGEHEAEHTAEIRQASGK